MAVSSPLLVCRVRDRNWGDRVWVYRVRFRLAWSWIQVALDFTLIIDGTAAHGLACLFVGKECSSSFSSSSSYTFRHIQRLPISCVWMALTSTPRRTGSLSMSQSSMSPGIDKPFIPTCRVCLIENVMPIRNLIVDERGVLASRLEWHGMHHLQVDDGGDSKLSGRRGYSTCKYRGGR